MNEAYQEIFVISIVLIDGVDFDASGGNYVWFYVFFFVRECRLMNFS